MTNIWFSRANKLKNKLVWSTISALSSPPQIKTIHHSLDSDFPYQSYKDDPIGEYVKQCVGPAYIEPDYGYIIDHQGNWIIDSLYSHYPLPQQPWRIAIPAPAPFFAARNGRNRKVKKFDTVISLRHFWEWNYYHFYLDVLGKLQLFDKVCILKDTPIILGSYAAKLPFVQQVINHGRLKNLNWVIQGEQYIQAENIYYCRSWQNLKQRMDFVLDRMDIPLQPQPKPARKLFLTRKQTGSRHIVNMDEILPVLEKHQFEIIDTANMSIAEQIDLFAHTRYLVAIHGAGITNIIYRRNGALSLLELHPTNWHTRNFINICHDSGYHSSLLPCQSSDPQSKGQQANLYVDPQQLDQKIGTLLQT